MAEVVDHSTEPLRGVRDYAVDRESADRLWALSARLTDVNAFAAPSDGAGARGGAGPARARPA